MGIKKKLFPRKAKEKDSLVAKAKSHIHRMELASRNFQKRAEISRQNAKIALKRGEKERAKAYLIQYKNYQKKIDRMNNIRTKIENSLHAIEEGQMISQTGDLFGGIRDTLKEITIKASPERVAEIAEDSEQYIAEIEESAEILGGDLEVDLGISVDDELNELETEILLDQSGEMPSAPSEELKYIPEYGTELEDTEMDTKEKLQSEIEKLRKELEG